MSWTKLAVSGLVIVSLIIIWMTRQIWAAAFLGVLLALSLNGPAMWIRKYLRISPWLSTLLVMVVVLAALAMLLRSVGAPLISQMDDLARQLPDSTSTVIHWLDERPWGERIIHAAEVWSGMSQEELLESAGAMDSMKDVQELKRVVGIESEAPPSPEEVPPPVPVNGTSSMIGFGQVLQTIADALSLTVKTAALLGVSLVVMIFVAFDPNVYQRGILWLVPRQQEKIVRETMERLGVALRWWMLGRITSMVAIGAFTTLGMWMISMPSPMALGVLTGLFSFVPNIGPISAAVPGLLLALGMGPWMVVWALGVYLIAQLIESNAITPLVDQYAVSVPAGVLIVAQFVIAALAGVWGMLVATPLLLVIIVLVQQLYVREGLNKPIEVTGST